VGIGKNGGGILGVKLTEIDTTTLVDKSSSEFEEWVLGGCPKVGHRTTEQGL
jgi:hypothetical protein